MNCEQRLPFFCLREFSSCLAEYAQHGVDSTLSARTVDRLQGGYRTKLVRHDYNTEGRQEQLTPPCRQVSGCLPKNVEPAVVSFTLVLAICVVISECHRLNNLPNIWSLVNFSLVLFPYRIQNPVAAVGLSVVAWQAGRRWGHLCRGPTLRQLEMSIFPAVLCSASAQTRHAAVSSLARSSAIVLMKGVTSRPLPCLHSAKY